MIAPQGRCYWAVAPFSPEPPFRIYAGPARDPVSATTAAIVNAAGKGDPQFDLIVAAKARPVLVLTEILEPYDEILALRLRTFDKIPEADWGRVRDGGDTLLHHLAPSGFPGLAKENAAIVTALLRLPATAIDTARELGVLTPDGLRDVHERVTRAHGFKLDVLALRQAHRLIEQLGTVEP